MTKNTWAKILAWVGAAITGLAANGAFGKYSSVVGTGGGILSALATHKAADTSGVHPDGGVPAK
jgi:hypothetical protein